MTGREIRPPNHTFNIAMDEPEPICPSLIKAVIKRQIFQTSLDAPRLARRRKIPIVTRPMAIKAWLPVLDRKIKSPKQIIGEGTWLVVIRTFFITFLRLRDKTTKARRHSRKCRPLFSPK